MRVLFSPTGDASSNNGDANTIDSSKTDANTTDIQDNSDNKKKPSQAGTFSDGVNEGFKRTMKRLEKMGYEIQLDDDGEFDFDATIEKGKKKDPPAKSGKADADDLDPSEVERLRSEKANLQRLLEDKERTEKDARISDAIKEDMPQGVINPDDSIDIARARYDFKETASGEVRIYKKGSKSFMRDKHEEPLTVKAFWKEFFATRQHNIKIELRGGDDNAGNVTGNRDGNSTPSRDKQIADEKKRLKDLESEYFNSR